MADAPAREAAPPPARRRAVHSRWPSTLIRRLGGLSWERGRPSSKVERRRNGTRSRIAVPERFARVRACMCSGVQRAARIRHVTRAAMTSERFFFPSAALRLSRSPRRYRARYLVPSRDLFWPFKVLAPCTVASTESVWRSGLNGSQLWRAAIKFNVLSEKYFLYCSSSSTFFFPVLWDFFILFRLVFVTSMSKNSLF